MQIQWFPGHMKKTVDIIQSNLKLVDCVAMILDARVPKSCENPIIKEIVKQKPLVYCFNKIDLSDQNINFKWENYYREEGNIFVGINAKDGENLNGFISSVRMAVKQKNIKKETVLSNAPSRKQKALRLMIVGIPNVGKSTLINRLVGKKACVTGNKPGVTRGKQWLRLRDDIQLLDTPGVLWHKFDEEKTGLHLALTGAIKDEILPIGDLALKLIEILKENYPDFLIKRYKLEKLNVEPVKIMEDIALKRNLLISGGAVDYDRTARVLLDEFRKGIIGRISIEKPDDFLEI